jgi:hypothetical protein
MSRLGERYFDAIMWIAKNLVDGLSEGSACTRPPKRRE